MSENTVRTPQESKRFSHSNKDMLKDLLEVFECIRPVKSLPSVRQGDAIVSASGNVRLALSDMQESEPKERDRFLLMKRDKSVSVESASLRHFDISRLFAVISRRGVNPIGKFGDIAASLEDRDIILSNIESLLPGGPGKTQIKDKMALLDDRRSPATLRMQVSVSSGKILDLVEIEKVAMPVNISVNLGRVQKADYIEKILFPSGADAIAKRNMIASGVFTNSLQNAFNFASLVKRVESETNESTKLKVVS